MYFFPLSVVENGPAISIAIARFYKPRKGFQRYIDAVESFSSLEYIAGYAEQTFSTTAFLLFNKVFQ